jgi:hypothetical protein
MISVFKSLSKGTQRAIIVGGVFLSSLIGAIITGFEDDWLAAALILGIPVYCVLVAMGLWVYSGYRDEGDYRNGEIEEMAEAVRGSVEAYSRSRQEYESRSKTDLLDAYAKMSKESKEDIERLALEDELVERGMLDESKMRKKAQNLEDKMLGSNR